MDLYTQYLKERENVEVIRSENGFATYRMEEENFVVLDIFVDKKHRDGREYVQLGNQLIDIAKNNDYKNMVGFVSANAIGSTESMRNLIAYGFKIKNAEHDQIVLIKEL